MKLTDRQEKLLEFVKEQHGEQVRKYTGEPYWHHVLAVAELVSEDDFDNAIEIALCHDLFEDTKCQYTDLHIKLLEFGYDSGEAGWICHGVTELTDQFTKETTPQLNRKLRKSLEAERISKVSAVSQTVKCADLIDNTSTIVKYDPDFAVVYLKEKLEIIKQLRNAHIKMFIKCCWTYYNAVAELENVEP